MQINIERFILIQDEDSQVISILGFSFRSPKIVGARFTVPARHLPPPARSKGSAEPKNTSSLTSPFQTVLLFAPTTSLAAVAGNNGESGKGEVKTCNKKRSRRIRQKGDEVTYDHN